MNRDIADRLLQQPITLSLPLDAAIQMLELLAGAPDADNDAAAKPPTRLFGTQYRGGQYAGLTIHDNAPHELILLPGEFNGVWNDAIAWAEQQGGVLPSRFDALMLFTNLKDEFKSAWHWTADEYAGDAGYAWIQGFDNGGQSSFRKSGRYRARAVRRVPI